MLPDGETPSDMPADCPASQFAIGFLVGLLVGEGHFGGDGRSPQVTLRMHVRHSSLFSWIQRTFPGGRLYGPYLHDGRHYFQWMARGEFLRDQLAPLIDSYLSTEIDSYSRARFDAMRTRYARRLGLPLVGSPSDGQDDMGDIPGSTDAGPSPLSDPGPQARAPGPRHAAQQVGDARLDQIFSELRQATARSATGEPDEDGPGFS